MGQRRYFPSRMAGELFFCQRHRRIVGIGDAFLIQRQAAGANIVAARAAMQNEFQYVFLPA